MVCLVIVWYFLRQSGNIWNGCYSKFEHGQFSEPVLLDENIFNKRISCICISPDNKILVVHSNKLDGYGDWDLYVSFIDTEGNSTKLINMGNFINTDQKETNATFSPN